jgi:hypothetical protein
MTAAAFFLGMLCVMAGLLALLLVYFGARMLPTTIARSAIRLAGEQRAPRYTSSYQAPGFIVPVGFWRLIRNRREYAVAFLVCENELGGWRQFMRMTRGQRLFDSFGWRMETLCRNALASEDARSVLEEAKRLARSYPPAQVAAFAGHPSGMARGFELMRDGMPYEYAELVA